jgi:hypothetical protein
MPISRAASLTGVGKIFLPLPASLSGWEMTSGISAISATALRAGTEIAGVPKKSAFDLPGRDHLAFLL